MIEELEELFALLDRLFKSCQIDYDELRSSHIDESFFAEYTSVRIVNSFLFNYSKIQDKLGAKLFKKFLYVVNEIEDIDIPMIDVLNILERIEILTRDNWEELREIRNALTHEYPFAIEERIQNLYAALDGYVRLKEIFGDIKTYTVQIKEKK